jgi:cytochrome c oxidase subunit I+III
MTPPAHSAVARPEVVSENLAPRSRRWSDTVTSSDHKAVGRMYIETALIFLTGAVTILALMRLQLLLPDSSLMRPVIFDRLLSTYGVTAMLLFAVPLLLGLISYIVPLQIGSRGVALPRINSLSYWLYLVGGVTIFATFLYRPSEAGTIGLMPLADDLHSAENNGVDAWAAGVALVVSGFVLFAINMIATVRANRAPGMVWRRVPLFSVAATIISYVLLVVGPIMVAAMTMVIVDRNFDGVFFDPGEGGSPLLYAHLAWIFFTGTYVVVLLGAFGAISEIVPTFSRRPQFAQRTIAGSMAAFAVLGVLAWMQNMYSAPISVGWLYFAMAMALAAIIPVGLILFNWIATLRGTTTSMRAPMRFAAGAIVLIVIGLAGEWAQAVIPVGWQIANTATAWGDTHFAMIGAGVLGGFAALYYWFPKITGRYMGESLGRASFGAILVGSIVMIVPIQLAGLDGMAVDISRYPGDSGLTAYNVIGSIGAFVLVTGILLTLVNAAASFNGGATAGPDAWGGNTLEWFALSPPPAHNFDLVPDVRSNEPLHDIRVAVRRRATALELPPAGRPEPQPQPEPEPVAGPAAAGSEGSADPAEPEASATADEGHGPVA